MDPQTRLTQLKPSPIADLNKACVAAFTELQKSLRSRETQHNLHPLVSTVEILQNRYSAWQDESGAKARVQFPMSLDWRVLKYPEIGAHVEGHMKVLQDLLTMCTSHSTLLSNYHC